MFLFQSYILIIYNKWCTVPTMLVRGVLEYKDFQELSREQLKVFFNYMIDHIDIRELDIGDDPKVYLAITIHLKLNGYAPNYSIEYLRKINTEEKQKASHSKNDLLNGGGEGGI